MIIPLDHNAEFIPTDPVTIAAISKHMQYDLCSLLNICVSGCMPHRIIALF